MKNKNNITFISICLLVIGFILCIFYYKNVNENQKENVIEDLINLNDMDYELPKNNEVTIHIVGAVASPGVYTLSIDSRVQDAVNLAGGSTEDADLSKINLAAIIEDAQQIHVPAKGEIINTTAKEESGDMVNINTATAKELSSLPGIGTVTAEKIIEYRESNGKFSSKEDIMKVDRIANKTYENLKELIKVD